MREDSLHWHALNYRTAPTQNAQVMFEALEKFVEAAIKEALAQSEQEQSGFFSREAMREHSDFHVAQPEQEPVAGEPLPCPFCGHVGLDFEDGSTYRWGLASCGGCGASTGDVRREYPDQGKWHVDAIADWNRRTNPPQRKWVGLTDEEVEEIFQLRKGVYPTIRATEAKLKEKNT